MYRTLNKQLCASCGKTNCCNGRFKYDKSIKLHKERVHLYFIESIIIIRHESVVENINIVIKLIENSGSLKS